jgi:hypothetical protein
LRDAYHTPNAHSHAHSHITHGLANVIPDPGADKVPFVIPIALSEQVSDFSSNIVFPYCHADPANDHSNVLSDT